MLIGSCGDPATRHRILTFFFDGVPPLEGEADQAKETGSAAVPGEPDEPRTVWYVHEANKDCSQCHGQRKKGFFSRQVNLVATIPELCYTCHTGYARLEGYVHGPVALGQCLFCHDPHKTRNKYLLRKPQPELCYLCHDEGDITMIAAHAEQSPSECTRCHEGHTSSTRHLLKKDWNQQGDKQSKTLEETDQSPGDRSDNM